MHPQMSQEAEKMLAKLRVEKYHIFKNCIQPNKIIVHLTSTSPHLLCKFLV